MLSHTSSYDCRMVKNCYEETMRETLKRTTMWLATAIIEPKLRAGLYECDAIRFLTVQRHAMPPDEYAHLCEVRESRFYLDQANYSPNILFFSRFILLRKICHTRIAAHNYRVGETIFRVRY